MAENRDTCSKCGEKSILKGDIGLRNSKTMDLVVVVRQDHGVEKNVPLQPKVCGKCGFVDLYVKDPAHLKICQTYCKVTRPSSKTVEQEISSNVLAWCGNQHFE